MCLQCLYTYICAGVYIDVIGVGVHVHVHKQREVKCIEAGSVRWKDVGENE